MLIKSLLQSVILILLVALPSVSQATNNKPLKRCKKAAVYQLSYCLDESATNTNHHCWVKSQQIYDNCLLQAEQPSAPTPRHNPTKSDRRLDKRLKADKIRTRLMAAATTNVYQNVLEQALSNFEHKQASEHLTGNKLKALQARQKAFTHYLSLVEKQVPCSQMKTRIIKAYSPTKKTARITALPSAAREIIKLVPSYCRVD
jgi:hypothetical protein